MHYVGVEGKNYFVCEGWPEALVGSQTVLGTILGWVAHNPTLRFGSTLDGNLLRQ